MKRFSLYGLITIISVLVRQFILSNPFESFGDMAILYNWIAEPILHIVAYTLVGLVYCKGTFPAWGSFLYLVTYSALVGILWVLGIFSFAWWWILLVIVGAIAIFIGIDWLINKFSMD